MIKVILTLPSRTMFFRALSYIVDRARKMFVMLGLMSMLLSREIPFILSKKRFVCGHVATVFTKREPGPVYFIKLNVAVVLVYSTLRKKPIQRMSNRPRYFWK